MTRNGSKYYAQSNLYAGKYKGGSRNYSTHNTIQIGVSGTAGGGAGGTGGGGVVIGYSDENGLQFGTYSTYGGGGYGGVNASATIDITFSTNKDINDLAGTALTTGGSAGGVITGGAETNIPSKNTGAAPSFTGSFGLGVGLTPVETHGFVTETNINDYTGEGSDGSSASNDRGWGGSDSGFW